ncbi:hypothetical protein [Lysobacter arvi]|uniref:Uncharacterized protein n=1 Tax=Lysobacter arvi TaxID=3038776 RepID=A0ABU1CA66_9GAMM|nr:hypothetical protein [Lysobacter arvi]MDR0182033.1 hypothetical protein [Lysobacter arvi]
MWESLFIALFVGVIANDFLLARKVRKAVALGRLAHPDLDNVSFGGSPIGIALNVWRLRKIPATHELSDPDHITIRLQYRAQQILVALLLACLAIPLLRTIAS